MSRFLSFSYWFSSGSLEFRTIALLFSVGVIISAIGLILNYNYKKLANDKFSKELYIRITNLLLYMGAFLLLLTFFYYEGAYILSFKFWFLLWFGVLAYWAYTIIRYYKTIEGKRLRAQMQKEKQKYLS